MEAGFGEERAAMETTPGAVRRRILCCDDDPWALEMVRHVLKPHYDVDLLTSGDGLVGRCVSTGADLVILDVQMPHPDGLSLLKELRADPRTRRLPVLMLTSDSSPSTVMGARKLGASGYVLKPVKPMALVEKVGALLEETATSVVSSPPPALAAPDAGFTHDEILSLTRTIESDLSREETMEAGYRRILSTLLSGAGLAEGALFILNAGTGKHRLAAFQGLSERLLHQILETYWDEIMKTLKLSVKETFEFRDPEDNASWTVLGLRAMNQIPAVVLAPRFVLPERIESNPGLRVFLAGAANLLNAVQFRASWRSALVSLAQAFSSSLDAKDAYTRGHTERVTLYALAMNAMAERSFPEYHMPENDLRLAGFLHDIGKIGIPDAILGKKAGLSKDEFEIMKTHVEIGRRMMEPIPELRYAIGGVYHHERFDGTGYPESLAGDEIPLAARYLAVADSFDAMTSDRPYRKGLPIETALAEIKKNSGTQFDSVMAELFYEAHHNGIVASIMGIGISSSDGAASESRDEASDRPRVPEEITLKRRCDEVFARLDEVKFGSILGAELSSKLQDPDATMREIAMLIEADAGLTAKILQLANSAFYGFSRKIASVEQGIIVLGLREVKHIIYLLSMMALAKDAGLPNFDVGRFWRHSLIVGVLSRHLAARFMNRRVVEEAFLAGLMHDIAKLALIHLHPDHYARVIERVSGESVGFAEAEQKQFGLRHDRASAYLINRWNLPLFLTEPLLFHHEAEMTGEEHRMSRIVRCANLLSYMGSNPLVESYPHRGFEDPAFRELKIPPSGGGLLEEVASIVEAAEEMMKADMSV